MFSGIRVYLGEGVHGRGRTWGTLCFQLELHTQTTVSMTAYSCLSPWGLISSAGRDLSAKAHWPLEGRSWV